MGERTGPLAIAACASLVSFAVIPGVLLILAVSDLFGCYQMAANTSFVQGWVNLVQGVVIILVGAAAQHVTPNVVIAA